MLGWVVSHVSASSARCAPDGNAGVRGRFVEEGRELAINSRGKFGLLGGKGARYARAFQFGAASPDMLEQTTPARFAAPAPPC